MQSAGQGAMQSLHPVHSAAMTVCMKPAAPTIASTGQAAMHSAQPMQRASSIAATLGDSWLPKAGSSGA